MGASLARPSVSLHLLTAKKYGLVALVWTAPSCNSTSTFAITVSSLEARGQQSVTNSRTVIIQRP